MMESIDSGGIFCIRSQKLRNKDTQNGRPDPDAVIGDGASIESLFFMYPCNRKMSCKRFVIYF